MDQLFERFIKKIHIEDVTPYQQLRFTKCTYDKSRDVLSIVIHCPNLLQFVDINRLLTAIKSGGLNCDYSFEYEYKKVTGNDVYNLLRDEFIYSTGISESQMPKYQCDKNVLTFTFFGQLHYNAFEKVLGVWEELLDELDLNFELNAEIKYDDTELQKREQELKNFIPKIQEKYGKMLSDVEDNNSFKHRLRGNYQPITLKEINEDSGNVSFKGIIFQVTERVSKKGKLIESLYVYDGTDSIEVTLFENFRVNTKEKLREACKLNNHVMIRGAAQIGKYSHGEVQVIGDFINVLEEPFKKPREDKSEEKRVEFHVHSKMSNMDAVSSITEYVNTVARWGHKAIALTDHGVVQAFPEAQKAAKAAKIKMIYGSEMYMVDDNLEYIMNPSEIELSKASYVVFDFETTGLSCKYDRVIEFGAVKFKDGLIVDNMDMFIDPEIELSPITTELTHITTQMVKGKTKIKEALKIMKEFIGDSILVAHNAQFDIGFLNEAFINNGETPIKNPVIDTLPISRYLFPTNKSHTLGSVCRQFDVTYNDNEAHRANYDAEVLNSVWLAMLSRLSKDNSHLRHCDLAKLENPLLLKTQRTKHITVYAKNAAGLKDLFKLISFSHVDYFENVPRIPRSKIEEYRKNLLIGSACFNGEVFDTALTRGEAALLEKMKFYDFIEVQPPANYVYLINIGQVRDMDSVKRIILDVINAADKLGKKVIATSDCHYCEPDEKVFRDVYIGTKAVGGKPHPLHLKKKGENPDQHLRTTDEMMAEFDFIGKEKAEEIVIKNTNELADQFEEIFPIKDKLYPPHIDNCQEMLIKLCYDKAKDWYGDPLPKIVSDRLEAELSGIIKYGYSVQYYIAHRIVKKSREDGYMVGSRGSVGSSFVATMASITEVNPLPPHYRCPHCKYSEFVPEGTVRSGYDLPDKLCPKCGTKMIQDGQNIPFATFLGFKAEKVPDIDLNFSGENQSQAHDMTKVLLGENNVFRAGTIETVAEKTAFGYVLGYFENQGIDPNTIRSAEKTRLALGCMDVKRTTGQHPGGIIVIPRGMEVYDFTAVQYPADDQNAAWKTTHFDFHAIHDNVLKLDLLGHVDPTALKMLGDFTGIKPESIPINDPQVISLFSTDKALKRHSNYLGEKTGALGLPEFGTPFVRQMLVDTQPKCFADLLIISGLSHGTDVWIGNAQDLVESGKCTLRDVIGCRDDIMIGLSQKGIDPSTAFKIMEAVRKGKKLTPEYEDLLRQNHIPEYYIASCNKIKYLFPKAHAVAYVMMACRVAWYKVYRPLEYYAVFFSTRSKQFDIDTMIGGEKAIIAKLEEIKKLRSQNALSPKDEEIEKTLNICLEMAERGYKFEELDLYKSDSVKFLVDHDKKMILPPFIALDNLGENAAQSVVEARKKGKFFSVEDLLARTKLTSTNVDHLRKMGVLKDLPESDQLTLF